MLGPIYSRDTQLQSLVDHHSTKDNLDHLGNAEVLRSFLSHGKVEVWAKFVVVLKKRPKWAHGPPQVPLESSPDMVGYLLGTKKVGKHHDVEKS